MQNRLKLDSPFLLRFGTRQCGNLAFYLIEFESAQDDKRHEMSRMISAPLDRE